MAVDLQTSPQRPLNDHIKTTIKINGTIDTFYTVTFLAERVLHLHFGCWLYQVLGVFWPICHHILLLYDNNNYVSGLSFLVVTHTMTSKWSLPDRTSSVSCSRSLYKTFSPLYCPLVSICHNSFVQLACHTRETNDTKIKT